MKINISRPIHIESFNYCRRSLPVKLQGKENKAVCTIDYPFPKGKTIEFTFRTIGDIVRAVRNCLTEMYNYSEQQEQSPMLINQVFEGDYGSAYHSIGDLFIDDIEYDTKTYELNVSIVS